MNQGYTYSLLKYKHSAIIGECLNLGILVYFHNENKLYFKYPNKLHRIKAIYSEVAEKLIFGYLKEIQQKVTSINKNVDQVFKEEIENSIDIFIENYILPPDNSVLQFEKSTSAFQYSTTNTNILNYLIDTYFLELSISGPDKEYELGRRFYRAVKNHVNEVGKSNTPNFYKDYKIQSGSGVQFNFKYAWKNGSLNLVKPLNFDLSDSRHLARKAHENYGLFVDLERVANAQSYRFDLIIGAPRTKVLFKEFEHAVELLDKIKTVKLIEETNLDQYTAELIESVSEH